MQSGQKDERDEDSNSRRQRKRRPKLGESIANDLRKQILDGTLAPGDALSSEDDLAAEFGVSRPTLREAIRILESESLLTPSAAYGELIINRPHPRMASKYLAFVLQSDGVTLSDAYRARDIFEPAAARIVTENDPIGAATVLGEILAQRDACIPNMDMEAVFTVRFHETLVELTGNKTLTIVLKMFHAIFEQHLMNVRSQRDSTLDDTIRRAVYPHQAELVSLIRAGDGDKAEAFWRSYLSMVQKEYLRLEQLDHVIGSSEW